MKPSFDPSFVRCIAGIGNPEQEYANTYHNAGLQFIVYLRNEIGSLAEDPVSTPILFSSPVSMNLSGPAVRKALAARSLKPRSLLLAHDDSDLSIGTHRVSFGSGHAGHRGVRSVIDALGTNEFYRLRFGIRDPLLHYKKRAADFVLRPMTREHAKLLHRAFVAAAHEFNFLP